MNGIIISLKEAFTNVGIQIGEILKSDEARYSELGEWGSCSKPHITRGGGGGGGGGVL